MAFALSVHTPRVQLSVYNAVTSWPSELGQDTLSGYLESAGKPVYCDYQYVAYADHPCW